MYLRAIPLLTFSTTTPDLPGTGANWFQFTLQAYLPIRPWQCVSVRSGERLVVKRWLKKVFQ
jgi:hypothetical protein